MSLSLLFRHDVGWNLRRIVARVTGAPVHVALCWDDVTVIEADGERVRRLTKTQRLATGQWTVVRCDLSAAQADDAYRFATAQVGKRYDWAGVLWAWWWGRGAKNAARDKWFCSELAAAALMAAGVNLQPSRAAAWTPRRLWNWCAPWRS